MAALLSWFRCCIISLVVVQRVFSACKDCYTVSRATYYGATPDDLGNPAGACGYGAFGRNLNGGDVTAVSNLYRGGTGCGACYQVKCAEEDPCKEEGVKVVVTDMGGGGGTDFIMSRHAFAQLGRDTNDTNRFVAMGTITILYRRISCVYPGQNIMIKIDENSNFPSYLAFLFYYQGGSKDIVIVNICETKNLECKLRSQNHGAVWDVVSPPQGALSIRFLVSDSAGGQEQWFTSANAIPANWVPGALYDTGIQLTD
ncbi:hypothetical protein KI387_016081 [Taxus chinensis]|uniref:Expansin-like B1 n=1 Tax=Taxus chinensis TaxID=29808 RepID=A0AA38LHR5_TAXCH|nr:hypothetical protein KI387_016081 [Taxus chinensis]